MSNGSGQNQVQINTLERASSADVNRLQQYSGKINSEAIRGVLNRSRNYSLNTGSVFGGVRREDAPTVSDNPLPAVVLNGLLLTLNSTTIDVDPGTIVAAFTDAATGSYDSDYLVVSSAGTTALAFTAHSTSGNGRWDVLECRPTRSVSTASRDIYNDTTKAFTSTVVDKYVVNELEFRIRLGTSASSGVVLTTEAGWLPLAAMYHDGVTTSLSDVLVFDVRPLLADMITLDPGAGNWSNQVTRNYNVTSNVFGGYFQGDVGPDYVNNPGLLFHSIGYRVSGPLAFVDSSGPAFSPDFSTGISIVGDAFPYSPGTAFAYSHWYCVNVLYPFGLPRWVPYSQAIPSGESRRMPLGIGGIPSITVGGVYIGNTSYAILPSLFRNTDPFGGWFAGCFYTKTSLYAPGTTENLYCHNNECRIEYDAVNQPYATGTTAALTIPLNGSVLPWIQIESIDVSMQHTSTSLTDLATTCIVLDNTSGNQMFVSRYSMSGVFNGVTYESTTCVHLPLERNISNVVLDFVVGTFSGSGSSRAYINSFKIS